MRGVRFTKAEVAALRFAADMVHRAPCDMPKGLDTAVAKLAAAEAPLEPRVNVGPIEEALVRTSRGRVIKLAGGGGYARASIQATSVGATVEGAELVGAWLARQGWWKQGPTTILTVLTRWPEWYAKAQATEPPPSLKEGLGANARPGAATASEEPTGRRPPSGFR